MEERGTFCCWGSPFSSFELQLPHPLHCPRSAQVAPPPTRQVCPHLKLSPEEGHWPWWLSLASRRLLPQTLLSPQRLILQLLPLAQAARDYLKPQPFIYEKWEPDIILIDCHLLNISRGGGNRIGTLSARIMELFLDAWAFLLPSLIEVVRLSHLLIEKGNLFFKNPYTKGMMK